MGRTKTTRLNYLLLQQEKGTHCINCNSTEEIQYHHVIPLVKGGNDILTNIVPLCVNCHNLVHSSHLATNHSTLIKEGLQKRKTEGKSIGRSKGQTFSTNKEKTMKIKIQELSLDFQGDLSDLEVIQILDISRNTYYKYKKRIKEELNSGTNN